MRPCLERRARFELAWILLSSELQSDTFSRSVIYAFTGFPLRSRTALTDFGDRCITTYAYGNQLGEYFGWSDQPLPLSSGLRVHLLPLGLPSIIADTGRSRFSTKTKAGLFHRRATSLNSEVNINKISALIAWSG